MAERRRSGTGAMVLATLVSIPVMVLVIIMMTVRASPQSDIAETADAPLPDLTVVPVPTWTPTSVATNTPLPPTIPAPTHTPTPTRTPRGLGTVTGNANLRAGPGTNFTVVGDIAQGEAVRAIAQSSDGLWLYLATPAGKWIFADLVEGEFASLRVKTVPTPVPVLHVDALDLIGAFNTNQVRADRDFKGKMVVVSGRVNDIDQDWDDRYYIEMGASRHDRAGVGYFFIDIRCYGASEDKMAALSVEQHIVVQARVKGFEGTYVELSNCRIL